MSEEINDQEIATPDEPVQVNDTDASLAAMELEIASLKETVLRKAADFENLKRRTERERYTYLEQAKVDALRDFLPLNDDLNRSIEAGKHLQIDENFLEGVKMVADKFAQVISKYQVERIDQVNIPFDVNVHDALLQQPAAGFPIANNPAFEGYKSADEIPANTVLAVLEPGYKMGERVIRHAKVIVSI